MDARVFINQIKENYKLSSDEQLAVKLEITKASIDKWVQRNKIPDKWMLKLRHNVLDEEHNEIKIPNQLNSHISKKELEILQAYRELDADDQEIFYFKLKAAAAEARKKAKESNSELQDDVKSAV